MKRDSKRFELILLAGVVLLGIDILTRLPAVAQASQPQSRLLGMAATQSKSGSNTVIWRHWSNGAIDKRLYNTATGLTYEDGWVNVQRGD